MGKIMAIVPVFLLSAGLTITSVASMADTNSKPIVLKVSDVVFHQAPGFPKGAEIVNLRGDLTKAERETIFQVDGIGPRTTAFVNPDEWKALILKSNQ